MSCLYPLERLVPAAHLTGEEGVNRAPDVIKQIAANDDLAAIHAWLSRYTDTEKQHTFRDHRKEAERLLLWAIAEAGKPLSSITVEDCVRFRSFLADPQPAARWIGPRTKRFSTGWRPFSGRLSPASRRHAEAVVGSLFAWLKDVGYLAGNPWKAMGRIRVSTTSGRVDRILNTALWGGIAKDVLALPNDTVSVRLRFLVMALYLTRARIAELAAVKMSSVFEIHRGNRVQWWLSIMGKGGKARDVPIPGLMPFLREYRAALGLPAYPAGEDRPLIGHLHRPAAHLTANGMHALVKGYLQDAAERLQRPEIVRASAHWFRHSSASHGLDGGESLQSVRESLGHASLQTTSIYVHADRDRQYDAFEKMGNSLAG